jgi:hypothetical protein
VTIGGDVRSDELCELLKQKYGITMTPGKLLDDYIALGLVLRPDSDFGGFTAIHAAMVPAADYCIQKLGWIPERVGLAVGLVGYEMASGSSLASYLNFATKSLKPDLPEDRRAFWDRRINEAFRWGVTVIKAYNGAPLDAGAAITEEGEVAGTYQKGDAWVGDFLMEYHLEPAGEDRITCRNASSEPYATFPLSLTADVGNT